MISKRKEKCEIALKKGFKYNPETGNVTGVKGAVIRKKVNGYIALTLWFNNKRNYLLAHQFAWYMINNECVNLIDHIDKDKLNNKISNLRSTTRQINALNTNSSGVTKENRYKKKWVAYIMVDGKSIYLGKSSSKEKAMRIYSDYKKQLIKDKIKEDGI